MILCRLGGYNHDHDCGSYFLAATLQDCGLLDRVAFFLLCKVRGNYLALLVTIMLVAVLLNIFTSGRGYMIIAPLCAGLCLSMDGMKKRLGAAIAAAAMIGGCQSHAYTYLATTWGVIMNSAISSGYIQPLDITPASILLHNWPLFIVSLITLLIAAKWFKPKEPLGNIDYFQERLDKMGAVTRKEKVNALMLVVLLVYIFTVQYHKLDLNLGFALIPWMVYLPFMRGADAKTWRRMPIDMVFFVAGCMAIGSVAGALGLGKVMGEICISLLGGSNSIFVLFGSVFGAVFGLNFLMTPMAIFVLITEPMLSLGTAMGYSPIPILYAINACAEAIILPYEYVPYLIIYGFGMMTMKDFIKFSVLRSSIFFAGFLLLLVPYWLVMGLL